MGVSLRIHLWTKPSWMMDIEGKTSINPTHLLEIGEEFREHLQKTAAIIDKLQNNNWVMSECYGAIYDLEYYKEGINTISDVENRLNELGIDVEDVMIDEYEDDEECFI